MAEKKTTSKKKAAKTTESSKAVKKSKATLGATKKTASIGATKSTSASKKKTKAAPKALLTPEQRFVETQQLAYFLAEKDGFTRNPTHYWLDAETALGK